MTGLVNNIPPSVSSIEPSIEAYYEFSIELSLSIETDSEVFTLQPLARASRVSEKEPEALAKIDDAEDRRLKRNKLTDCCGTKCAIKKDKEAIRLSQKADSDAMPEISHKPYLRGNSFRQDSSCKFQFGHLLQCSPT